MHHQREGMRLSKLEGRAAGGVLLDRWEGGAYVHLGGCRWGAGRCTRRMAHRHCCGVVGLGPSGGLLVDNAGLQKPGIGF